VSCTSSASCIAVGTDSNGGPPGSLIESWNGTVWSIDSAAGKVGFPRETGQPSRSFLVDPELLELHR
jgi:hypothetical protein